MCKIPSVQKIVQDASSVVSFIRNSGLGEKCNPKLKKYVESRWNTVYNLFNTLLLNYTRVAQLLLDKEEADKTANVMDKISIISRTDLEKIAAFLKNFTVWSERLEADKTPTLWMVWPTFVSIQNHLEERETDESIIKQMKEAGRLYLDKNLTDFAPTMTHKISTVLHPLLKQIALASKEEKKHVYSVIDDSIWVAEPFHETRNEHLNEDIAVREERAILEAFMGSVIVNPPPKNNFTDELERYLALRMPLSSPYDFKLCEWWHRNRHTFPNLYRLFVSKAGITASSAPSERKFSETGIILTARRSNMLPETVSDLVLARNSLMNFL